MIYLFLFIWCIVLPFILSAIFLRYCDKKTDKEIKSLFFYGVESMKVVGRNCFIEPIKLLSRFIMGR